MPPSDNNAPAPVPTPEEPKKPGFFARLFGKKAEAPSVPVDHQSQTPPPQLDESQPDGQSLPTTDQTAGPSNVGEQNPPTVAVPPAVEGAPASENDGIPPTLPPVDPPAGETQPSVEDPAAQPTDPSDPAGDDTTPPSNPVA